MAKNTSYKIQISISSLKMNQGSGTINRTCFRLTDTPDRDSLVTFYYLDMFDQAAVNWQITELAPGNQMGPSVLCEGHLENNTAYRQPVFNLLERVRGTIVNGVRSERVKPGKT